MSEPAKADVSKGGAAKPPEATPAAGTPKGVEPAKAVVKVEIGVALKASEGVKVKPPKVEAGDRVEYTFVTSEKNAKAARENPRRKAVVAFVEPDGELTLNVLLAAQDGLHGFTSTQVDVPFHPDGLPHTWRLAK